MTTLFPCADCARCPRLAAYRNNPATAPATPRRYPEAYWGRPVPGFGDPRATLVIVGLAPAYHGGNRTGRPFTGDGAGDFLYDCLHALGLASQPTSSAREDGLRLHGVYVTNAVKCAPPGNRPTLEEIDACAPFLRAELAAHPRVTHLLALGAIAHRAVLAIQHADGHAFPFARFPFGHGAVHQVPGLRPLLVDCYHPSRQNLNTGVLTRAQFLELCTRMGWQQAR